jgi:hypothetical protein
MTECLGIIMALPFLSSCKRAVIVENKAKIALFLASIFNFLIYPYMVKIPLPYLSLDSHDLKGDIGRRGCGYRTF